MFSRRLWVLGVLFLIASTYANAAEYQCNAEKKFASGVEYTSAQLARGQFSNRVEEITEGAYISRCSFGASENKVTCDRYRMDRIEFDDHVKIKKFYHFRSQFDF